MLANDTWYYSAEKPEGHLFFAGEIPGEGWHDSPAGIPKATAEPAAEAEAPDPGPLSEAILPEEAEAPDPGPLSEAILPEDPPDAAMISGVRDGETVNLSAGAPAAEAEKPAEAKPKAAPKKPRAKKPAAPKVPAKKPRK